MTEAPRSRRGSQSACLFRVCAIACLAFLTACAVPPPRKVLVVGIDGLRSSVLEQARTPTLDRLAHEGVLWLDSERGLHSAAQDAAWSALPAASWAELLTGVRDADALISLHGEGEVLISDEGVLDPRVRRDVILAAERAVRGDEAEALGQETEPSAAPLGEREVLGAAGGGFEQVPPTSQDSEERAAELRTLFGRVKLLDPELTTALFHTWGEIGLEAHTPLAKSREAIDYHFSPGVDGGRMPIAVRDSETTDAAAQAIADGGRFHGSDIDLMVVQWMQVSHTARLNGISSPSYVNAVEAVDHLLGRLVDAIETRKDRDKEQWLVVVTANPTAGKPGVDPDFVAAPIPFLLRADVGRLAANGTALEDVIPSRLDIVPTALRWLAPPETPKPLTVVHEDGRVLWIGDVPEGVADGGANAEESGDERQGPTEGEAVEGDPIDSADKNGVTAGDPAAGTARTPRRLERGA